MTANNEINDSVASILGISDSNITAFPAPVAQTTVVVIAPLPPPPPRPVRPPIPVRADGATQIDNDAEYARDNLYDVLQRTTSAIDELMMVAQQTQHPRSYEVLNQLLNTQRDTAALLLKLQGDRQKLNGTGPAKGNTTIHAANAVFVGTNAQLLDLMKGKDRVLEAQVQDAEYLVDDEPQK